MTANPEISRDRLTPQLVLTPRYLGLVVKQFPALCSSRIERFFLYKTYGRAWGIQWNHLRLVSAVGRAPALGTSAGKVPWCLHFGFKDGVAHEALVSLQCCRWNRDKIYAYSDSEASEFEGDDNSDTIESESNGNDVESESNRPEDSDNDDASVLTANVSVAVALVQWI